MEKQGQIPCAECRSWHKKEKKFSCNPDNCNALTSWLFKNAPKRTAEVLQIQVQMPEPAMQYVV